MAELFDKDGNKVEAFTQEEFEAKKKDAIEEYAKANPDKTAELTTAQQALNEAKTKIEQFEKDGGSDEQKKRLKEGKDEAEKALSSVTEKLTKEMKDLKDSVFGGQKNKMLEALSKGDVETRKKIELEYDSFKGEPANEVEIQERLVKATTIVTGNKPQPNFMDGSTNGNTKGAHDGSGSAVETEASKQMRTAFGISDADATKFGNPTPNA